LGENWPSVNQEITAFVIPSTSISLPMPVIASTSMSTSMSLPVIGVLGAGVLGADEVRVSSMMGSGFRLAIP